MPGENWQDVLFYTEGTYPNVSMKWFPRPCMHCEHPSCVSVCPTKATYKDPNGGFVLVDWNKCIGCKYCQVACPYGVRFYMDERAVIQPDIRTVFPSNNDRLWDPPYKGPQDDPSRGVGIQPHGVVSKCTFCYHRTTNGLQPACVEVCPSKARIFGDQEDGKSEIAQILKTQKSFVLKKEAGTQPNVHYVGKYAPRA